MGANATLGVGGSPETSRPAWHAHGFNRAPMYRAAAAVGTWLPRPLRLRLAAALARPLRPWFVAEWNAALANAARIAPAATPAARRGMAVDVFRHFAMCFSDLLVTNRQGNLEALVGQLDGERHFLEAVRAGQGLVVLTAHLGNWELGGRLAARVSGRATHVVMEAEPDPHLERLLRAESPSVRFVTRRHPTDVLGLVAALHRGEIVAMQGDRAIGSRGDVAVAFFGALARFPLGPFVLARSARVPVVPAFCLLQADRRYRVRLLEPLTVSPGGEMGALTRWVATLERMVRDCPEQWFNFFDCWGASSAA
jgi:lauroyl/myristoyl acyltransferase